jgi:putative phage-type endonuclease
MNIIECEQGTPEWYAARCGRVTASRVADIVRKTKSGISAMRNTYIGVLVAERLSGRVQETFQSAAMLHGHEAEDMAREFYGFMNDCEPERVGFVIHPRIEMAGASPDRLIGDRGLLEIKCPNSATHIETLLGAAIDPDYFKQMQWQMACTGRDWTDFCSFDPRMPGHLKMKVHRIIRDSDMIDELETAVFKFLTEVESKVSALNSLEAAA